MKLHYFHFPVYNKVAVICFDNPKNRSIEEMFGMKGDEITREEFRDLLLPCYRKSGLKFVVNRLQGIPWKEYVIQRG